MTKEFTLADLEQQAGDRYEKMKANKRRLYHLARELGFSGAEATVLQNKTEEVIRKLAAERDG